MPGLNQSDIDQVLAHCFSKVGVFRWEVYGDRVQLGVLGGSLSSFAVFHLETDKPSVLLRCDNAMFDRLVQSGASIKVAERMQWAGPNWKWTDVLLDGSLSLQALISLLDNSYDFVVVGLDDSLKHRLSVLARKLPPRQVLAEMIENNGLQHRRTDIERLLLPALRLKTSRVDESQLTLGSSKIGGHPDLPPSLAWPTYRDGRPLSFLGQINLGEIPPAKRLAELPSEGIFYIFSIYGWQAEGTSDPDMPDDLPEQDWTQILFAEDTHTPLERRATPDHTSEYPAAGVTFHSLVCLPSEDEPNVAALQFDEDEADRYSTMTVDFTYITNFAIGPYNHHLLLGYASWIQYAIDQVKEDDLRLLIQVSSDRNTDMCWGDAGHIYALVSREDLKSLRFSNITTDHQCC